MKTPIYQKSGFLKNSFSGLTKGSVAKVALSLCAIHALAMAATNEKDISTLPNCNGNTCTIDTPQSDGLDVKKSYDKIINNATITPSTSGNTDIGGDYHAIDIGEEVENVTVGEFINNGTINGLLGIGQKTSKITHLINNGNIKGILRNHDGGEITRLDNYGNIYLADYDHTKGGSSGNNVSTTKQYYAHFDGTNGFVFNTKVTIGDYHLHINQDVDTFNNFSGYTSWSEDTSHLVIRKYHNADATSDNIHITKDSRFIITMGENYTVGGNYDASKFVTSETGAKHNLKDENGEVVTDLFSYLAIDTQSSIFALSKNQNGFGINLDTSLSIGNAIYKSRISSINNLISHINIATNDAMDNQICNPSQRNADGICNPKNYHFFFTPFITRSTFNKKDGFGLSGLDYGFVTGFSFDIGSANLLGIHTAFSYGNLNGEKAATRTYINPISTNINQISTALGLHYKLGYESGPYLKAIADWLYLQNEATMNAQEQSPDALGFDVSVYIGDRFDLDSAGYIDFEVGVNGIGLQNDAINFADEIYTKNYLYLIYSDFYLGYGKKIDSVFGLNVGLGTKYLFNQPKGEVVIRRYSDTFDIGVDKALGYVRLGADWYVSEIASFNLYYIGSFGDKSISNSGMFNVRLSW